MNRESGDELGSERTRELEVLHAVAESLNGTIDLSESLRVSLSRVAELLGLRTGWVWLLEEESAEPYLAAAQELPPGLAENPEAMEGRCYCLDRFQRGDLDGAANVVTCSRLKWIGEGTGGLKYHASVPLHARGKRVGVMNLATPGWRALSSEELRVLHTVGDMVGVAVERARLYLRSAEAGASEERNRLAREIHDTLAQELAATALQLETADALLEGDGEAAPARRMVRQALESTRRSLEEARRSVLDLRAAPLQGRTLVQAVEELCADGEPGEGVRRGPTVRFRATGAGRPLPARVEVALYRVAQEAIANARTHAAPASIGVSLDLSPDQITLAVEDDGRGFDPESPAPGRYGLLGMRERIRLLGGEIRVRSTPGAGTRVEAVVPLR